MKHECENCAWARKSDGSGMIVKGNTMYINNGNALRCTAGTIAKMDLRGDEMYCSSFRARENGSMGKEKNT